MIVEWLIVAILAAGLAAGVGWAVWDRRRPPRWLEQQTRRRLLVHTRDGQTLDGQLTRVDRDGLVLEPATLADGPHRLDGRVWIDRDRVAWIQQPQEAR